MHFNKSSSYDGSSKGGLKNQFERREPNNRNKSTADSEQSYRSSACEPKQRFSLKEESQRSDRHSSHASRRSQKMSDLNLARGHSPHFSPSRSNPQSEAAQTLHVHLPNHGYRMIKFDEAADVRQIINLIVGSMSHGQKSNPQSYALRLRHILTKEVKFNLLF